MRSSAARAVRALPTLLRIGVAETVAYRAEFLVWMLTSTMPLINLAFWTAVARDGAFEGYDGPRFTAYFLGALIVRNLTGNWVAWQLAEDIRMGVLSMRLLRPIHPVISYACIQSAALPFRSIIALPVAVIMLVSAGNAGITHDPVQLLMLLPSILLAWAITFGLMFALGCLSFWITQSFAIVAFYFGLWSLFSGYIVPMDIMTAKFPIIGDIAKWMPFYSMLGAPIEMMTKQLTTSEMLHILGVQTAWAAICVFAALRLWSAGVRRFEAVGN
ncbi:MAG TPA: ABC-2 family transporter protein [Kofleriaceae bacterium]|nr:ABC-2 family transporter protein [Kofleriaceae bacterium]